MKNLLFIFLVLIYLFSGCSKSKKLANETIFTTHHIVTDFEGMQVRVTDGNIPLIWSGLVDEETFGQETFVDFRLLTGVREDGSPLVFLVATNLDNNVNVGMELIASANGYVIGKGKTCACVDTSSPGCDLQLNGSDCMCSGGSNCTKTESLRGIVASSR